MSCNAACRIMQSSTTNISKQLNLHYSNSNSHDNVYSAAIITQTGTAKVYSVRLERQHKSWVTANLWTRPIDLSPQIHQNWQPHFYTHNRHSLLLSLKADTHFTIP